MRVLIVSTKSPWPPVDGGRLLLLRTIESLREAGDEVTLVAPVEHRYFNPSQVEQELARRCRSFVVESETLGVVPTVWRAEWTGTPLTIVRHSQGNVRSVVERLIRTEHYDVVHAEQQQAVAQTRSAVDAGIPVVLRAQNVESRLWVFAASHRNALIRPVFMREARRLARWEGRCVDQAKVTVALTAGDAADLRGLSDGNRPVIVAPPPFRAVRRPEHGAWTVTRPWRFWRVAAGCPIEMRSGDSWPTPGRGFTNWFPTRNCMSSVFLHLTLGPGGSNGIRRPTRARRRFRREGS
jgi:hypothetical protein